MIFNVTNDVYLNHLCQLAAHGHVAYPPPRFDRPHVSDVIVRQYTDS
jgi:hypothetical protein